MELRELLTQVFTGSLSAQIELISTFQDFGDFGRNEHDRNARADR